MNEQPGKQAQRRERNEPDEMRSPIPRSLALFAVALFAWGGWYYFENTGYPVGAGDRRTAIVVPTTVDGATVFAGNCVACHQSSGQGLTGIFPTLVDSAWVLKDDARLVQILLHGINGQLVVKGVEYNGVMPAFAQLRDVELAAVLTYIRTAWGNDASSISEQQVAEGRSRFPADRGPWQGGEELNAVFGQGADQGDGEASGD